MEIKNKFIGKIIWKLGLAEMKIKSINVETKIINNKYYTHYLVDKTVYKLYNPFELANKGIDKIIDDLLKL